MLVKTQLPLTSQADGSGRLPLRWLTAVLGALVASGGAVSLLGWYLKLPGLTDWAGTGISIKANTAVGLLASGCGLLAVARRPQGRFLPMVLGSLIALLGGLTLLQYATGLDLQIDELLVTEPPGARATSAPGRMGPPACISFLLIGSAFVLLAMNARWRALVPLLAIAGLTISLLAMTGYLYGAELMFALPKLTGIAFHTAVLLFAIDIGLLCTVPEQQPVSILQERSAAGLLARCLLPVSVLLPLLVGWVRLEGQRLGMYDTAFGAALRTLVETMLLAGLLWWTVLQIRRYEAAARDTEQRKDEFLALLAHELRNPLAPVMNTLALLDRQHQGDAALAGSLGIMQRQMTHMVRLVDDLLDVSRISRGKLELRKQPCELTPILRQALEMTRPLATSADHEIALHLPSESIYLHGDASRLAQSFGNILNNACRYTGQGGKIEVTAERQADTAIVTISDNGIGIPPDKLEAIFGMFTQVDSSLERATGGLGIGLHLVKQLVEMHGGRVVAQSGGIGKGSKFVIHLPVSAAVSSEQPRLLAPATAPEPKKARVLVVDDNLDSATTLTMLLKISGYETAKAHDGEEAVAKAEQFVPDVVLLDIGLPKKNGYEACREIRARRGNDCPLLIALTGWGQEDDRRKATAAGFDAHLTKPVDHQLLLRTLQELQQKAQAGA